MFRSLLLCFLLLIKLQITQGQINLESKEIELLGYKTSIFQGNDNSSLRKYFGDKWESNLSWSGLFSIDSNQLINAMEFIERNNPGYQIPSTHQLFNLYHSNIYKTPATKEKINCKKTLICQLPKGVEVFKNHEIIELEIYVAFFGNKKFKHPHRCKNCEGWSEQYKAKVACHSCKDERITFCGQSFTCPICKGSGYRFENVEEKTGLSLESFLQFYHLDYPKLVFYYNKADDFGFFDMVNKNKLPFGMRINEAYLKDISYLLFIGNESVKQKIEDYNTMIKKNDDEITAKIESYILKGEIEDAAKYTNGILSKGLKIQYQSKVQGLLNTKYSNERVVLDTDQLNVFITKNIDYLSKLNPGIYLFETDRNGKARFNDFQLDFTIKRIPFKSFGETEEYKVNLSTLSEIKIQIDTVSITNASRRYQSSDGSNIKWNAIGKPFKVKFYNGSLYTSNQDDQTTEKNTRIPKNEIHTVQQNSLQKKANSILLVTSTTDRIIKVEKLTSRLPNVLFKTASLSVVSFFGLLRLYENSLIPK